MDTDELKKLVIDAMEDLKATAIKILDVRSVTSITDLMIIASGTSTRHIKSIADYVAQKAKESGWQVLGVEGDMAADWVLVDIGDIVVHIMLPDIREFYALEKLWAVDHENAVNSSK